tara:strand:- start:5649 stop:6275 length:627 start_codon:yes stop_codon:yes gene_type:complete
MLSDKYDLVFYFFFLCLIFDYLDGYVARRLNVVSDFGKQLDSLADLISFGALPSVITYFWFDQFTDHYIYKYSSVLILLFSAYRLAKFNLQKANSSYFIGLPTPANATLFVSLYYSNFLVTDFFDQNGMLLIVIFSSFLMISNFTFFSFKFDSQSFLTKIFKYMFFLISIFLLVYLGIDSLYIIILIYIILSLLDYFIKKSILNNIKS